MTNTGPSDALAAIATDPLPEGLTVRDVGPSSSQGSCRLLGRTVSCDLGTVAGIGGAGTVTITIPVTVDPGYAAATLVNSATVSSSTPDPDPANNTGTDDAAVTGAADLTLTKTGPATLLRRRAARAGPCRWSTPARRSPRTCVVTDPIPAGLQGISVSATHGSCAVSRRRAQL